MRLDATAIANQIAAANPSVNPASLKIGKEIKRIRWTERKDLVKYSICTLLFVVLFGVYFYAIDWLVLLVRSLAK